MDFYNADTTGDNLSVLNKEVFLHYNGILNTCQVKPHFRAVDKYV